MDPLTVALAAALGQGLAQVGQKLVEKGVIDPALEPLTSRLKQWVQKRYKNAAQEARQDRELLNAVQSALAEAGAPVDDKDKLNQWGRQVSLDKLQTGHNPALRRQLARAALTFNDPNADPPDDLVVALGWPRQQRRELAQLLAAIHKNLYALPEWQAPLAYAQAAAQRGTLETIMSRLAFLDNVYVATEQGQALRVVLVNKGLSFRDVVLIENRYRQELVRDLRLHDFRGIVQVKRAIRLPLADIYLELALLPLGSEKERQAAQEHLLEMREAERLAAEERRLQNRVTDALGQSSRLLILGEPGAGKTISLHFIALMLAYGYGAARLGLDAPYVPIMVRLADFARELEKQPHLSLDNFLFQYIEQAYASHKQLGDFLRLALDKGACLVLLDGLDEVGDDPVHGQSLRGRVVARLQQFADRWCDPEQGNRCVVTSRIEGYWDEPLRDFVHVQLSPLRPPDEVGDFLRRWFTAYEQTQDAKLPVEVAEQRAEKRVADLLPPMMGSASVRRLATNPLLLTILALIHETVGKLPNRRIKLYEICAQTLIESWRQAQTGLPNELLADLGEETVIRIMAPLAYWLHEERPGGTASFQEWQQRLKKILVEEGFESEAGEIAGRFLHHARYQAGLLAERGLGQFGFFHLTFEEYLAARQIARQRAEERRQMLQAHWPDPRWHEILLLAAGQLGIAEAKTHDASDLIEELLKMEEDGPENAGRQVVLAGRALADIGPRSVSQTTRRWVMKALQRTMQDADPDTEQPHDPPRIPVRTRYEAGEALDELGWLPPDLNSWLRCPDCAADGGDLLAQKYPVTNAQFALFVAAGGYENPEWWGGERSEAWRYRLKPWYADSPQTAPRFWQDARFGQERRGYPVVGVSWYEANAFAAWLTALLRRARAADPDLPEAEQELVAGLLAAGAGEVRLPTEKEWVCLAGGEKGDRCPWDSGPATRDEKAALARANTSEAGLNGTSPVAMYVTGQSHPNKLMDLGGNVWEWMANERSGGRALRGGSWYLDLQYARVSAGRDDGPNYSDDGIGFRLVAPVSGS